MISVLIVEDQIEHQMYLNTIVNSDSELKCLGIVRNGLEAIKDIIKLQPNVVLIDIGLPDISGIECIKQSKMKCLNTKFMICTVNEEDEKIFEALKVGAHSYIVKRSKPYQIIDAIKSVYSGETPISSSIATKILAMIPKEEEKNVKRKDYNITPKENEILKLLSVGHSYQEISDLLYISIKTLKWHIHNIYNKLHADNRTEALNKYFGDYSI